MNLYQDIGYITIDYPNRMGLWLNLSDMAAPPWITLATTAPTDGATVWIRVLPIQYPIKATWTAAVSTFTTLSGLVMPWYMVAQWRAV